MVVPSSNNIAKQTMDSQFMSHVTYGHDQFLDFEDAAIDFFMVE